MLRLGAPNVAFWPKGELEAHSMGFRYEVVSGSSAECSTRCSD
jgi:hypothetical protein